jgi:hypothetical protein
MKITIYQQPDDGWITLSNQVRYNKKWKLKTTKPTRHSWSAFLF